jgi:hypothetical protein
MRLPDNAIFCLASPHTMTLLYLDFDYSEDDEGTGTWDAMASVTPKQLSALLAEIELVLAWAHEGFAGRCGAVEDGDDWDYDLQTLCEAADTTPLHLGYDAAEHHITVQGDPAHASRHIVTLSLSGRPAFGAALRARFAID